MLLVNFLWKKFHDFIAEAPKAFAPYFEAVQDGFVKRTCDADLELYSWVLDVRMNTVKKTEEDLLRKYLKINKQLQKKKKDRET